MPSKISDYQTPLKYLSSARVSRIPSVFNLNSDIEIYGYSIWSQKAAASLYPVLQQFEIILRNSIDSVARARFGDYWWDTIIIDTSNDNHKNFLDEIKKAKKKLSRKWKAQNAAAIALDPSLAEPTHSHDDIIAVTEFFAWETILTESHNTSDASLKANFLWPLSLSKVFKRLDKIDHSPNEARKILVNKINEIREYRNRLFHHDCIWIKSKTTNTQSAIDSIREKLNLMEELIYVISPATHKALDTWGVFKNAKRVCSIEELSMYTNLNYSHPKSDGERELFSNYYTYSNSGKSSVPIQLEQGAFLFCQLR